MCNMVFESSSKFVWVSDIMCLIKQMYGEREDQFCFQTDL